MPYKEIFLRLNKQISFYLVRNFSFNRMLILWYVSIIIISRFVVFIKTKYIFVCCVLFCGMCETVIKIHVLSHSFTANDNSACIYFHIRKSTIWCYLSSYSILIARFIHFKIEKEVINHIAIFFCKCIEKDCINTYTTFHHLCNFKTDDTIDLGGNEVFD